MTTMTKNQHYIPQVYLRGFSPEYDDEDKKRLNSKYTVYCYDLSVKEQNSRPVPVKSICRSKYLYEVTGRNNEKVFPNHLEKFFSVFEKKFAYFKDKLKKKASVKENFKTNYFLSEDEKQFWVAYIIIQILRMPQVLEMAESLSKKIFGENMDSKQSKNISRIFCLPFFKEIDVNAKEKAIPCKIFNWRSKESVLFRDYKKQ